MVWRARAGGAGTTAEGGADGTGDGRQGRAVVGEVTCMKGGGQGCDRGGEEMMAEETFTDIQHEWVPVKEVVEKVRSTEPTSEWENLLRKEIFTS